MILDSNNFPSAFAAMNDAAKAFWAYPDLDWQDAYLRQWAQAHADQALIEALGVEA